MQKWEKLGIVAAIIAVVAITAFTSSSLSKGSVAGLLPQAQKIALKSPISPVLTTSSLNQDPPNCVALNAIARNGGISNDANNAKFLANWRVCASGNLQMFNGFPTICEAIDLALSNDQNNTHRATLLSEQATCRRGGIVAAPLNRLSQTDGGQILLKNCVLLEHQNAWQNDQESDNLSMCRYGNHIMDNTYVKNCDVARFALAENPAKYSQLRDDVHTCNNGEIDN